MIIGGFQKNSLIDYPKKICCIIFVQACNFRCPFCYNSELISKKTKTIAEEEIFNFLKKRKKFIDAVVIGGGEPTLYKDLLDFCKKIKELGFLIKIDTNGSNPELIQKIIKNNLVNYIAMDIKSALNQEDYEKATNTKININNIKKSIEIIKKLDNYEFRTTCVPEIITKNKLISIGKYLKSIKANKTFYLQQFQPQKTLNKEYEKIKPYSEQQLKDFQKAIEPYFKYIGLRT